MRLFVAVELPAEVRRGAAQVAEGLRAALSRARAHSRMTWVAFDRMHLTLVFLGELGEEAAGQAIARMAAPLPIGAFTLALGRVGMFPPGGRPRVVWLAVTTGASTLQALHEAVTDRLRDLPWRREDRPFAPHLTLARFKEAGTLDERRIIADSPAVTIEPGRVDHVTLFRSRLSPRGPDYEALAVAPLRGRSDV